MCPSSYYPSWCISTLMVKGQIHMCESLGSLLLSLYIRKKIRNHCNDLLKHVQEYIEIQYIRQKLYTSNSLESQYLV